VIIQNGLVSIYVPIDDGYDSSPKAVSRLKTGCAADRCSADSQRWCIRADTGSVQDRYRYRIDTDTTYNSKWRAGNNDSRQKWYSRPDR